MSLECLDKGGKSSSSSKIKRLQDRAWMFKQVRQFFQERGVMEVDCPLLSPRASVDTHIDLIYAIYKGEETRYLHSSPEFGMKRLLVEGAGDIYQFSHVFRDGEWSVKHNPEFMMTEWYRLGFTLEKMIEETIQFLSLFLGNLSYDIVSYRDLFQKEIEIDYVHATEQDLFHYIQKENLPFYPSILEEGKDALLNLILGSKIEEKLGKERFCVLAYYPASQAALAQKSKRGEEEVAERFEVYYQGIELANGYHELGHSDEQRHRFKEANDFRERLGKSTLPIDENFLRALDQGLPDCCGVAVGFDRLMMLRQKQPTLSDVLPWGWQEA